jgi:hypothetical protein
MNSDNTKFYLLLTCQCGHTRRLHPGTLAAIAEWDARLVDVVRRLRCSKYDERRCKATAITLVGVGFTEGRERYRLNAPQARDLVSQPAICYNREHEGTSQVCGLRCRDGRRSLTRGSR